MYQPDSKAKAWLDEIVANAKSGNIIPDSAKDNADKAVPLRKRLAQQFEAVPVEHKINAGMWGAGALMGAFGFASAAKNSVQQDAEGKNQIQWSSVGVALLQGALAAGCAYMGAQALRSGVGR